MRRVFLFAMLMAGGCLLYGQELKIGVFADPLVSWFASESRSVHAQGAKLGIEGGAMVDNYFRKNYALQTGIALGTQGGRLLFDEPKAFLSYGENDTLPAGTVVRYSINYIAVPLGLKLKTNEIGHASYYTRLGFSNHFNIKTKASSDDQTLNKSLIENEIFFYNLSYYLGIGCLYHINRDTSLDVALSYTNGFINLARQDDIKLFSRSVSLRLGIIF